MIKKYLDKPRISDAALLMLIIKGDQQGREVCYDTYAGLLFLAIIRLVPQRPLAEQVFQATFKQIWHSIAEYKINKERIFTWMIGIAKNMALEASFHSNIKNEKNTRDF